MSTTNFKKLNLDQRKIDISIQKWAGIENKPESLKKLKKGNGYHYSVIKDGNEVLLVVYLNNDGTTTLNPSVGKFVDASKNLAECVKKECLITEMKNIGLSFKNVSEDSFASLLSYLCESVDAEIISDKTSSNHRLLKIKGPLNDEITLTYFNTKTVLIQGKPLNLYVEIKLFFYEILPLEEVIEKEAEEYNIDIKINDVRYQLGQLMPKAYPYLDEKVVKVITPSLSLLKLNIQLEDYSSFVFPVLKGLEGYIKQILRDKGSNNSVRFVSSIGCLFKPRIDELQDFAKLDIACDKTCEGIEKSYSYWRSKRHPYFHMDRRIEMTPILYNKEDAEAIVHETLNLIEETYSKII